MEKYQTKILKNFYEKEYKNDSFNMNLVYDYLSNKKSNWSTDDKINYLNELQLEYRQKSTIPGTEKTYMFLKDNINKFEKQKDIYGYGPLSNNMPTKHTYTQVISKLNNVSQKQFVSDINIYKEFESKLKAGFIEKFPTVEVFSEKINEMINSQNSTDALATYTNDTSKISYAQAHLILLYIMNDFVKPILTQSISETSSIYEFLFNFYRNHIVHELMYIRDLPNIMMPVIFKKIEYIFKNKNFFNYNYTDIIKHDDDDKDIISNIADIAVDLRNKHAPAISNLLERSKKMISDCISLLSRITSQSVKISSETFDIIILEQLTSIKYRFRAVSILIVLELLSILRRNYDKMSEDTNSVKTKFMQEFGAIQTNQKNTSADAINIDYIVFFKMYTSVFNNNIKKDFSQILDSLKHAMKICINNPKEDDILSKIKKYGEILKSDSLPFLSFVDYIKNENKKIYTFIPTDIMPINYYSFFIEDDKISNYTRQEV